MITTFSSKCSVALALASVMLAVAMLPAKAEVSSSEVVDTKRPKICLVLSGGGARGAAHVGVLKVLEEYRIPIDCIAGTSMGALVGAAYASGTSIPDMEKLLGRLTTQALFQDSPPRAQLDIRRKQEDRSLLFSPELGLGSMKGDVLPKGMVSGVQLESVLREISAPGYLDFNGLEIPFRAVATDLVTGKEVVFDKGVLADVMRSSMSVPIAIAPVEVDGRLMVDGMLVNNMPVSVGREMGADVIIAVNVGTPLLKREQLGSLLGVAGQMLGILTQQNVQAAIASLKPTDILITPELGDFATSDFDHIASTLPVGEAAARKAAKQLSKLSLSPEKYALYLKGKRSMLAQDLSPVDTVSFNEMQRVNPEFVRSLMKTKPGKEIDQKELDADMRRIFGTGDFEHVEYRIMDDGDQRRLIVNAQEKNWGPNYFRFGLGFKTDFAGETNATIVSRYRRTWINSLGAEWVTDLNIGSTNSVVSEFYQPINESHRYFVAPRLELNRNTRNLYDGSRKITSFDINRYRVGFDFGQDLFQYGQIRAGVLAGSIEQSVDIGAKLPDENYTEGAFRVGLQIDKLDSVAFPQAGYTLQTVLYNSNAALGADDEYTKYDISGNYFKTFGQDTFGFSLKANGAIGSDKLPIYDQNSWGGFLRMSGYAPGQLLGQTLTYGRMTYYKKLADYKMFDGLYAGFSLEAGKMSDPLMPRSNSELITAGSAYVATDSPIGPIYLGYGRADDGNDSLYLFLGYPY